MKRNCYILHVGTEKLLPDTVGGAVGGVSSAEGATCDKDPDFSYPNSSWS